MGHAEQKIQKISVRQVVSGAIVWGLTCTLPFGLLLDSVRKDALSTLGNPEPFANIYMYAALSAIGCLLAWALPNSFRVWDGAHKQFIGWPAFFIGTAIPGLFRNLANHNLVGAAVNVGFIVAGLRICFAAAVLNRRAKMKSII